MQKKEILKWLITIKLTESVQRCSLHCSSYSTSGTAWWLNSALDENGLMWGLSLDILRRAWSHKESSVRKAELLIKRVWSKIFNSCTSAVASNPPRLRQSGGWGVGGRSVIKATLHWDPQLKALSSLHVCMQVLGKYGGLSHRSCQLPTNTAH